MQTYLPAPQTRSLKPLNILFLDWLYWLELVMNKGGKNHTLYRMLYQYFRMLLLLHSSVVKQTDIDCLALLQWSECSFYNVNSERGLCTGNLAFL